MNGGPSGFHNAPVTRAIVIASAMLTIAFGFRSRPLRLGLDYQGIFQNFRLWRVLSSALAFSSTPELMFGLYLLYYFRLFERQIGSNKYSVFVVFSLMFSTLLEVLALVTFKDFNLSTLASGPYGLIFASFVPFYFDVPVSTRFNMFNIHLSDKSFVYLAGLQLLLSSWKRSLVPGICGILAGSLYRLNVFGIRKIKFPKVLASFFSRLAWSSAGNSTHTTPRRNVIRNMHYTGQPMQGNYSSAGRAPVPEPSESAVGILVAMGFDSTAARHALRQARNDINVATNILLEDQTRSQ